MQGSEPIVTTELAGLELFSRGKVRDIYAMDSRLLIVTTDRISCFDVVLGTPIPWKGRVLTHLTKFWLQYLADIVPNHLVTADVDEMGPRVAAYRDLLRGRTMLVEKAEVLPVECVVRGYLAGSGWRSYRDTGKVCGIELPPGLQQSDRLPETLFTPTTKAEEGHDLPLTMPEVEDLIGADLARRVRELSLEVYHEAADYAAMRGVIICDTKFEWGLRDGELILIDEVLTPDSSRFWPADDYEPGRAQVSYDKQYVRDWLDGSGWDHEPPSPPLPDEVVRKTTEKYLDACRALTDAVPEA